MKSFTYNQLGKNFISNLSIIDLIFNEGPKALKIIRKHRNFLMNNQKIILGTAQFNNIYGISNNKIKLNNNEFLKIIKLMKAKKIYELDCADSYRNFHTLQEFLTKKFKITNKIVFNNKEKTDLNSIKQKFTKFYKNNLEVENLLIHNCEYISSKNLKILRQFDNS